MATADESTPTPTPRTRAPREPATTKAAGPTGQHLNGATARPKRPTKAPSKAPSKVAAAAVIDRAPKTAGSAITADGAAAHVAENGTGTLALVHEAIPVSNVRTLRMIQGAIGRADADEVTVEQGAIGGTRATHLTMDRSALGGALAGDLRIHQTAAGSLVSRDAQVSQSFVRLLIANTVVATKPIGVLFLVARRVEGNVRAVMDWRGALAFGAAFGLVAGIFRRRS